jgi:hypothetical protein
VAKKSITTERYYDKRGVLSEIIEEGVTISLEESLRRDIVTGKRKRKRRTRRK